MRLPHYKALHGTMDLYITEKQPNITTDDERSLAYKLLSTTSTPSCRHLHTPCCVQAPPLSPPVAWSNPTGAPSPLLVIARAR
jgi:hypothetical protein